MGEQIIVSISREYGSAGHEVAEAVAKALDYKLYDKNILKEIARENGSLTEDMEKYDEKPKNPLFVRKLGEYTNSIEEHIANMQFDYLKKLADSGESFVVVGRCADSILKDYKGLVTIFVTGDEKEKLLHVMTKYGIGEEEAKEKMLKQDKRRKQYHGDYSSNIWGDVHTYELCINSSKLGVDKSAELIIDYINKRFA
jgi:cytidylate kinase